MWCEKEKKRLKIAAMYIFLPLVRTKASELSYFPGVNTPLVLMAAPANPMCVQGFGPQKLGP